MGFLRIAAQVDNFRKTSVVGTGDYEADAKAAVLTAMLPAFEPFEAAAEVCALACVYLYTVVGGGGREGWEWREGLSVVVREWCRFRACLHDTYLFSRCRLICEMAVLEIASDFTSGR